MPFLADVNCYFIKPDTNDILVVENSKSKLDPFQWVKENKTIIENDILNYGAVLLRNFPIDSMSDFNLLVQILCPTLLEYTYRSTPRSRLGGRIYTATEYPADRVIPMHNENAYSRSWPQKIFFYSAVVATEGGETPVADSRSIYQKIASEVKNKFEKHGVLYVRNYTNGIDLSWQEVFQTDDKLAVEEYCKAHDIHFEWGTQIPELTTYQTCQATTIHPITNDKVWFNQAHLFHISALDTNTKKSLVELIGEDALPRNAFYGDGSPIEIDVLEHIREIYEQEKIKFKWQKKDILILDNLLMAHGRESYRGERKVAVAMA